MSQETIDNTPEIEVTEDFSPLDAPVKKRSYTQHHIADAQVLGDLEEPTFQPPSFSDFEDGAEETESEPQRPFNESYSELDNKEKKMGAKMMAEMIIDLYSKGCGYLGKIAEISESKLDRLIAEGEIDPNIEIPTESGTMGVKEFAREYNDGLKDAFSVSDEFIEKIKPPLERVLNKRGIGMTDEQLLAYYGGTDLATKSYQAYMLSKTTKSVISSLQDNTNAIREQSARRSMPKTETVKQETKVEPTEEYTEKISEAVDVQYEKPKRKEPKRKEPKTNLDEQVQFFEPEEMENGVYSVLNDNGGFKTETKVADNMPTFGDAEILEGINKIDRESNLEKPVRKNASTKRATTKRKTTPKKPRK